MRDTGPRASARACDGCGRALAAHLGDRGRTMVVAVGPVLGFAGDVQRFRFCGFCASEVAELELSMRAVEAPPVSTATLLEAGKCSFCEDGPAHPSRVLTPGWSGTPRREAPRFPLCGGCCDVVAEFLGNVPGDRPPGDTYRGDAPEVRVAVSTADTDAVLATFHALERGSAVSGECHEPTAAPGGPSYERFDGTVVERYAPHGIREVVLEGDDDRYRLVRPAPTVDAVTVAKESGDRWRHLGRATVLDADVEPASPDLAAPSAVPADPLPESESALVPDSLEALGSSD